MFDKTQQVREVFAQELPMGADVLETLHGGSGVQSITTTVTTGNGQTSVSATINLN